jgi:transcriptional regulator with XRE-family HTH domain
MYKEYRGDMKLKLAAKRLGISERTLLRYESGEAPVPCDVAVNMAKIYRTPKLLADHCSLKCEIGQIIHQYLDKHDLGVSVLRLLKELEDVVKTKSDLIEIASDGKIDEKERPQWLIIHKELAELKKSIGELEQLVFSENIDYVLSTKKEPVFAAQIL